MRELDLTQSQYEAIRDALIAQNVISAAAGQAYAGAWEDLLYGDLAEYGVGYAPVLGNIYFAKSWRARAAAKQAAASGGAIGTPSPNPNGNNKPNREDKDELGKTKHGDQRLKERGFTDDKIADIIENYSQKVYQEGGRTVYIKKNGNYYDVIIINANGEIVTAVGGNTKSLKTWKDVIKMLNNNGGYSSLPY